MIRLLPLPRAFSDTGRQYSALKPVREGSVAELGLAWFYPVPFAYGNGELTFQALPLHIHSAYKIEG